MNAPDGPPAIDPARVQRSVVALPQHLPAQPLVRASFSVGDGQRGARGLGFLQSRRRRVEDELRVGKLRPHLSGFRGVQLLRRKRLRLEPGQIRRLPQEMLSEKLRRRPRQLRRVGMRGLILDQFDRRTAARQFPDPARAVHRAARAFDREKIGGHRQHTNRLRRHRQQDVLVIETCAGEARPDLLGVLRLAGAQIRLPVHDERRRRRRRHARVGQHHEARLRAAAGVARHPDFRRVHFRARDEVIDAAHRIVQHVTRERFAQEPSLHASVVVIARADADRVCLRVRFEVAQPFALPHRILREHDQSRAHERLADVLIFRRDFRRGVMAA